MEISNRVRFYYYISGVLEKQQSDPLCGICKAFANSVRIAREDIGEFERTQEGTLPGELQGLLFRAKKTLAELNPPVDAIGQKKAGNCKMPEGICFVKTSKAIIEKI